MKTNEPKKPDFMVNPHKYFREKNAQGTPEFKGGKVTDISGMKTFFSLIY